MANNNLNTLGKQDPKTKSQQVLERREKQHKKDVRFFKDRFISTHDKAFLAGNKPIKFTAIEPLRKAITCDIVQFNPKGRIHRFYVDYDGNILKRKYKVNFRPNYQIINKKASADGYHGHDVFELRTPVYTDKNHPYYDAIKYEQAILVRKFLTAAFGGDKRFTHFFGKNINGKLYRVKVNSKELYEFSFLVEQAELWFAEHPEKTEIKRGRGRPKKEVSETITAAAPTPKKKTVGKPKAASGFLLKDFAYKANFGRDNYVFYNTLLVACKEAMHIKNRIELHTTLSNAANSFHQSNPFVDRGYLEQKVIDSMVDRITDWALKNNNTVPSGKYNYDKYVKGIGIENLSVYLDEDNVLRDAQFESLNDLSHIESASYFDGFEMHYKPCKRAVYKSRTTPCEKVMNYDEWHNVAAKKGNKNSTVARQKLQSEKLVMFATLRNQGLTIKETCEKMGISIDSGKQYSAAISKNKVAIQLELNIS